MQQQDEPLYLKMINVLHQKLKSFGVKDVLTHLSGLETKKTDDKVLEDIIVSEVCKKYNVQQNDVKRSYVKGEASLARIVIIALLKKHTKYKLEQIAFSLNKTTPNSAHVIVSRSLKTFKGFQSNIKHERIALEIFNDVDVYLQNHILINTPNEIRQERSSD